MSIRNNHHKKTEKKGFGIEGILIESPLIGATPLLPEDLISSKDAIFLDDNLAWNVKHKMRKTAGKQAGHMVQVRRQAELDLTRVDQAMRLRIQAVTSAAEWLDLCYQLGESYALSRPDLAKRVSAMVEDAADDIMQIPKAGMILFLRRYSLG